MIVYLSGPMSGLSDLGRSAFWEAEERLWDLGYKVLNPAALPVGLPAGKYMPICLAMIEAADLVCTLPGSDKSQGVNLEVAYARYQGIRVLDYEWLAGVSESVWE